VGSNRTDILPVPGRTPNGRLKCFTFVGETVLDPFWECTTSLQRSDRRNSIGYEFIKSFYRLSKTIRRQRPELIDEWELLIKEQNLDKSIGKRDQPLTIHVVLIRCNSIKKLPAYTQIRLENQRKDSETGVHVNSISRSKKIIVPIYKIK